MPIQLAMAAKQGLVDSQIAQHAVDIMVKQMFPQLAQQMQAQQIQQQAQQQMQAQAEQQSQEQQGDAPAPPSQMNSNAAGSNSDGGGLTKAAVQSLIAGQAPAM